MPQPPSLGWTSPRSPGVRCDPGRLADARGPRSPRPVGPGPRADPRGRPAAYERARCGPDRRQAAGGGGQSRQVRDFAQPQHLGQAPPRRLGAGPLRCRGAAAQAEQRTPWLAGCGLSRPESYPAAQSHPRGQQRRHQAPLVDAHHMLTQHRRPRSARPRQVRRPRRLAKHPRHRPRRLPHLARRAAWAHFPPPGRRPRGRRPLPAPGAGAAARGRASSAPLSKPPSPPAVALVAAGKPKPPLPPHAQAARALRCTSRPSGSPPPLRPCNPCAQHRCYHRNVSTSA